MTCTCPTCGSEVDNPLTVLTGLANAILGPLERDIVLALARAYPNRLSRQQLTDFAYRNHPDGGPVRADNCISVARKRANAKIEPHGWTIPRARPGQGSEGFRLVRATGDAILAASIKADTTMPSNTGSRIADAEHFWNAAQGALDRFEANYANLVRRDAD